ncbi:type II CAAX endopeptidase family protein [Fulvimonas yonginensis]|uniref:Type II CAAX endopeptidase family protein n=1 Tax=Fulvimonas yonginensis TaxID=1495200 RepID=A0ABU8JFI5_9GAMM
MSHRPLHPSLHDARLPHLGSAIGMIVLYFALQFLASGLVGLGLGFAVGMSGQHAGLPARVKAVLAQPDTNALMVILTLLLAASVTIALVRRLWPAAWSHGAPPGLGLTRPGHPLFYLAAVLVGLILPVAGGWLTQWIANGHEVTQDVKQIGGAASLALRLPLVLVVVSLGPLVEELLFRGALLSALLRRVGTVWAVAISSLLFACVHLPDLGFLWYAVPNLALLAVALAWLRLGSGSLWPAVVAHGVNNLLAVVAWFVAVKPG